MSRHQTVCTEDRIGRLVPFERAKEIILRRVQRKIRIAENGCWEWTGHKTKQGYGEVFIQGKRWRLHRLTYTLYKGAFDPLLDVCHTCDNQSCCNPDHLWLGQHIDNMLDHIQKGRHYQKEQTHCWRGHEFTPENTAWKKSYGTKGPSRACKACQRGRQRVRHGWPEDLAYSMPLGKVGDPLQNRLRISGGDEQV